MGILAIVCSQVFAAPPQNPESETWGDFMARANPLYRDALLNRIVAEFSTTPSPEATRGPKPEGGRADDDGNAFWGGWVDGAAGATLAGAGEWECGAEAP